MRSSLFCAYFSRFSSEVCYYNLSPQGDGNPDGRSIPLTPEWIENEAGERVESTPHAMEKYTMPTPELPPMSLLRRKTV